MTNPRLARAAASSAAPGASGWRGRSRWSGVTTLTYPLKASPNPHAANAVNPAGHSEIGWVALR